MMDEPKPGELRERITIKTWLETANAQASLDQTFNSPVSVWAKVEPVGAAIYHGTQQTGKAITHRFYIRYIKGITQDNVIEHSGQRYRIRRVSDMHHRQKYSVIETEQLGSI